jgi:hypothetical protein
LHKILDFSFWQGGESTDYIASDRIRRMLKICIPAELSYFFFFLLRRSRAQLLVDPHSAWGLDRLLRAIIPGPRPRVGFTAAGTTARSPQAPVPIGRGLDSEHGGSFVPVGLRLPVPVPACCSRPSPKPPTDTTGSPSRAELFAGRPVRRTWLARLVWFQKF